MAIELKNISKSFGSLRALDGVSLTFEEGKVYGLLGNNGAGKTTLLSILTNRIFADEGQVMIDGESAPENDRALRKVFMMGEQNLYPDQMKVRSAFQTTAMFYPHFDTEGAQTLAERFGLPVNKKITSLSTGYASIFRLIVALSAHTPYVIFDEPVLGLDAQHRDIFYRLLMERCAQGGQTVIFSTHLIQEAASLIEHAVIIRDGRILKNAPVEELLSAAYTVSGPAAAVDAYTSGRRVLCQNSLGGLKTATLEGSPEAVPSGLEAARVDLQDYFISLMNEEDAK